MKHGNEEASQRAASRREQQLASTTPMLRQDGDDSTEVLPCAASQFGGETGHGRRDGCCRDQHLDIHDIMEVDREQDFASQDDGLHPHGDGVRVLRFVFLPWRREPS